MDKAPPSSVPAKDEEESSPRNVPICSFLPSLRPIRRSSRTIQLFHLIFRIAQIGFSFAVLGLTSKIIATGAGVRPMPKALVFCFFVSIWSMITIIHRGLWIFFRRRYLKGLLFAMEVFAGISALVAGILYAVGEDYGACLGNESSPNPSILGFDLYPWNLQGPEYSGPYWTNRLLVRCRVEIASCVFFWLLFASYVGLNITVYMGDEKELFPFNQSLVDIAPEDRLSSCAE